MEEQDKTLDIEIDLKDLPLMLWRRKWIILASGILLAFGFAFFTTFFITDIYESNTSVYIMNNQADATTLSDLQSGLQLTKDYQVMAVSRPVLERVKNELSLTESVSDLENKITVTTQAETRTLIITVRDPDPEKARDIANAVRIAASDHIDSIVDFVSAKTVEEANLPTTRSSPNMRLNTVLGALIGFALSALLFIIIYFFDDRLKTPEDVERYLGVGVLASIPIQEDQKKKRKKNKNKRRQAR